MNENPFVTGYHNGHPIQHVSAADRIYAVKKFTLQQCTAARLLPASVGLQKTVRKAIEARESELKKQGAPV